MSGTGTGAAGPATSRTVLVLNSGSSSLKYQLVQPDTGVSVAHGIIERIGQDGGVPDHEAALRLAFDQLTEGGHGLDSLALVAVGHRVVHGGQTLYRPTVVDDAVLDQLRQLSALAPLHNPPAILGIGVARRLLPDVPHVAVFDTAFFHDLPTASATYAIDRDLATRYQIRRYGFHGTSHQYVSAQAADFLGVPLESLNQIVLHLGNGASASAIAGGRPVDTSMGLTPMEGLVMGTRSGDIDPGALSYIMRSDDLTPLALEHLINYGSGLLGVSETTADMYDLLQIEATDIRAKEAIDLFCYEVKKRIGAYTAALGGVDTIIFSGGIGAVAPSIRARICGGLETFGVIIEESRNQANESVISSTLAPVYVRVMHTDEERMMAHIVGTIDLNRS